MSFRSAAPNVIIKNSVMEKELQQKISQLDPTRIPRHIAIIMDGNGRWARNLGKDRSEGHYEGVNSVRSVTRMASDLGVGFLTLYAFSTENWQRPSQEVDILMHLIGMAIENETPELNANNVRLRLLGDIDRLPEEARSRLLRSKDILENNTGLTLVLALSYSSRWEITRAARILAADAAKGLIDPERIDDDAFAARLATRSIPDPDLLIRTGGELRISNFLLWQIAYSELYFTPVLWPDFGPAQLIDAVADFQHRQRRFGKTGDQIDQHPI